MHQNVRSVDVQNSSKSGECRALANETLRYSPHIPAGRVAVRPPAFIRIPGRWIQRSVLNSSTGRLMSCLGGMNITLPHRIHRADGSRWGHSAWMRT
ncbi:hypothetical protein TNCT_34081 [Trichonephila clavata]|uniref:Uncharacterized protein n=1 Tax=Trichonephila clavata TaxID=2740835 RepID=A0A8X6LFZ3_TRICU|nr:hypothetical protein TNCT_34081 [Trichonephila clavata]